MWPTVRPDTRRLVACREAAGFRRMLACRISMGRVLLAVACAGLPLGAVLAAPPAGSAPAAGATTTAVGDGLIDARYVLDAAARVAAPWNGPRTGPPAQPGKHIAIVGEDLRN